MAQCLLRRSRAFHNVRSPPIGAPIPMRKQLTGEPVAGELHTGFEGSRYVDLKYWVSGASIERSPWLAFAREATKPPLQGNQGDPDEDDTNRLSGQNHLPRHRCAQEDVLGDGDL